MTPTALAAAPSPSPSPSPAPRQGFGAILEPRDRRLPDPAAAAPGGARAAAREALESLERAQERLDRLLDGGRAARSCTAGELSPGVERCSAPSCAAPSPSRPSQAG
ncbi:MAG TPA: hypothetical protein VFE30_05420 [Anaeromyxobacteraceae bacterium]|jgi:hypothetical protein|nr:hypothetical protein [Anaeromyxobacteraceae bacterium]